ncbi:hypothetical protein GTZ99_12055 [Novosphingobium sp. FSY-8]|uniref:Uncharacterized protein n=1 Tax=Novosphingobium ovatum TaxID=1908523 RepID=A0ABW9XFG4_9SPHN|nr:hypothetical protein [Novosphingobium ovatum]NBC37289.1 hypothetical protein [Novosphingobium ovatum]
MTANEQELARNNLRIMAQFHGWVGFGYRTNTMGYLVLLAQAFMPQKVTLVWKIEPPIKAIDREASEGLDNAE